MTLRWYAEGNPTPQQRSVSVAGAGWFDPGRGQDSPDRMPDLLQGAWAPLTPDRPQPRLAVPVHVGDHRVRASAGYVLRR